MNAFKKHRKISRMNRDEMIREFTYECMLEHIDPADLPTMTKKEIANEAYGVVCMMEREW